MGGGQKEKERRKKRKEKEIEGIGVWFGRGVMGVGRGVRGERREK